MQKSQPKLISKHYSRLDTSNAAKNNTSLQKLSIDKEDSAASGTIENSFPQMGLNSSILFISNTYEPGENDVNNQREDYDGRIITRSTSVASRPIIIRPKT